LYLSVLLVLVARPLGEELGRGKFFSGPLEQWKNTNEIHYRNTLLKYTTKIYHTSYTSITFFSNEKICLNKIERKVFLPLRPCPGSGRAGGGGATGGGAGPRHVLLGSTGTMEKH
jgi:hypothetical protein